MSERQADPQPGVQERVTRAVRGVVRVVVWYARQMVRQFMFHDCLARASSLTYATLFAVVPLMTVLYAAFSIMPQSSNIAAEVQGFVFDNFVPSSSSLVQEKLAEFSSRAQALSGVGFAFVFASAFMMLVTIESAFNTIWHVKQPRRGLNRFLVYWGVLSLSPACIIVGLAISVYLLGLPFVSDMDTYGLREMVLSYLPSLLGVAAFTILYYAVPNCRVPLSHALIGGVVTTLLFEVAKSGFTGFFKNSTIEPIYGTFAALPLFLIWVYLVWVLVLSGAILVRTLSLKRESTARREPLVIKAARVLKLLREAHLEGRGVSGGEIDDAVVLTPEEQDRVFGVLQDMRVLGQSDDDDWVLGRNLRTVTLWDLYTRLPEGLQMERLEAIKGMRGIVEPLLALTRFGSNEMKVSLDEVLEVAQ